MDSGREKIQNGNTVSMPEVGLDKMSPRYKSKVQAESVNACPENFMVLTSSLCSRGNRNKYSGRFPWR